MLIKNSFSRIFSTIKGVIAILLGLLLLVFPRFSIVTLAVGFGFFAILAGLAVITFSFIVKTKSKISFFLLLEGIVDILTGIFILLFPKISVALFVAIIGLWIVFTGIILLILYNHSRKLFEKNKRLLIAGVLSILFGIMLMINPFKSAVAISVFIGVFAFIYGAISIYYSFFVLKKI